MRKKKSGPVAATTRARRDKKVLHFAVPSSRPTPFVLSSRPTTGVAWLRVHLNGDEVWYATEPEDFLTLRVEQRGGFEITWTLLAWVEDGRDASGEMLYCLKQVRPPGRGWERLQQFEQTEINSTIWRRRRAP